MSIATFRKMTRNQIINVLLFLIQLPIAAYCGEIANQKIHRMSCRNEAIFKKFGGDFMVKSSSSKLISSITARLLPDCARSCIKHSRCKSLIYKKKPATKTELNCQLLDVEKFFLANDDIKYSVGWIYYEPLQQVKSGIYIKGSTHRAE